MSLSMKLEQILVQKLVSSQAKKFQEKKFSSKVRIVLARIARLRKSKDVPLHIRLYSHSNRAN